MAIQTSRLYFHSHSLHSSSFVSHLRRSSSGWLGRSLPALLALAGTRICLRPCLLNIILYLYSISTPAHFPSSPGTQIPLPAFVQIYSTSSDAEPLIYLLPRQSASHTFCFPPQIISNSPQSYSNTSTTALYATNSVRHTADSSVVRYQRKPSAQPHRLPKTACIVTSSTTIPSAIIRDIESI